ncbi:SCO family protein [Pseudogracilibacillus sp. SO30301A]|uniref:SCO family protein n=1 Tax=Pseudogracilibacillus sp. SO30301A TaxID=3098291 RepID=UPI00300DD6A0
MKKWHLLIGMAIIIQFLNACNKPPIDTNMSENVADFSFTTQDNETLSLDDLHGEWWIADFIFTNCETVCLPMTSNLSKLQQELEEQDVSIQFVSFSVDPDFDTPEVLKEYGEQYDANFNTWSFLTGYDMKTIKELSIKSFRAFLKEPEYGDDQVMHDTRFFLVNPEGEVIKGYDGIKAESIDEILTDINKLEKKGLL